MINAGIPNYMITEKIDDGNTAKVYLAIHNRTGEEVAVKIVNKSKLKRDLLKNVLKEVRNKTICLTLDLGFKRKKKEIS